MAEALLNRKIEAEQRQDEIKVLSAGLAAGSEAASVNASLTMESLGLTLDSHCSRNVTVELVRAADIILTMTVNHKLVLLRSSKEAAGKTYTLGEYSGLPGDVLDPFGQDVAIYQECAHQLTQHMDKVWEKIILLAGKKIK